MAASLEIQVARTEDAAAACDVLRRSITALCLPDHNNNAQFLAAWLANKTVMNVTAWISDANNAFRVATLDNQIVGVAAMTKSGMVTLNYVSPDARFKGVSKSLLASLERTAAELRLPACKLTSTKTAERFYRSAGYRDDPEAKSTQGIALIKVLAPGSSATAR